ncbi:MATE family efflux transporter [Lutibacter sp. A80]|uniref:MATE family efflux transporter n=1 Tax=Lutibacter sp. A80 TaxID=2918453 RepID=UPI001F061C86|nr:MATE family efflux transporter [Lutibacter sp. A80]UMB61026.1 MATE family efflux transporter [Lutibacter sp. A80]
MNSKYSLKDGPIFKLLLVYAGPAVLGLLINAFYNIVDRVFVAKYVGAEGLSAVTMAFPISLFQFGIVLLFGSGAGIFISKYLGESRPEKAEKVLGNMIAGLLIIAVIFTFAGLLLYKPLLSFLGARDELFQLSAEYLQIIIIGFPPSFALALEFTCRAEGNPRLPAILILVSSVINIVLDVVFMKYLNMGIKGAALATITAVSVNAVFIIRYYISGKSVIKFAWKNIKLQKEVILPVLSVGLAPFVMDISTSIQNLIANSLLLETGGTYAVAAMGIIFSVNIIFLMTALGTGDGMQPLVSFNVGAKRLDRNKTTLMYALLIVGLVGLLGIVQIELFPDFIINLFINDNDEIIRITEKALQIFAISIPFYMIQIVLTRYFQALQSNKTATFLALLRPILLFVPIVYFLKGLWGLNGIWFSFLFSDFLAVLVSFLMMKRVSYKRKKVMLKID